MAETESNLKRVLRIIRSHPKETLGIIGSLLTLLVAIFGYLNPGVLDGNIVNITTYSEDSGSSGNVPLSVPSISDSSSESDTSKTPVTPSTQLPVIKLKENTNYYSTGSKHFNSTNNVYLTPSPVSESSSESENNITTAIEKAIDTLSNDKNNSANNNNGEETDDPTINSFDVTDNKIISGESIKLSWSISGAKDVTIDQGIGSVSPIDSVEISPTEDTTYTITAKNGVESDEGTVTKTVTVYVKESEPTTGNSEEDSQYFV